MRRLVLLDRPRLDWLETARAIRSGGDTWDVLCLGFSPLVIAATCDENQAVRLLDLKAIATQAHQLVTRFVLEFFRDIPYIDVGGKSLTDVLEDRAGNRWWYLDVTEKSPFRGPLINQLYHLALIRLALSAQRYDELWLDLSDASVVRVIADAERVAGRRVRLFTDSENSSRGGMSGWSTARYWLTALKLWVHYAAARVAVAAIWWPVAGDSTTSQLVPGSFAIFTLYPHWWLSPHTSEAEDRFFSEPPRDRSLFLAWVGAPRQLWRRRRDVRATAIRQRLIPLQRYLKARDALRLFSLRRFWKSLACARRIRGIKAEFQGFDVGSLMEAAIGSSLRGPEFFQNLLIEKAMNAFCRRARPNAIVYRFEGQPIEHALLNGAGVEVKSVGFMHSPFSDRYLPMRFAPGEVDRYRQRTEGAHSRPLPTYFLTCGTNGIRRMVRDGFDPAIIAACGPQRHGKLLRYLAARRSRPEIRRDLGLPDHVPVIFVAIAIIPAETESLFLSLERALSAFDDFRLVVKTHPNRPEGDEPLRAALARLGTGRAMIVPGSASMYDSISAADAMVCIGSTVAFEAIALGVMPVVFEPEIFFGATSLTDYQEALYVVHDADELRSALMEIRDDAPPAREKRRQWEGTLRDVLGDLQPALPEQLSRALDALSAIRPHDEGIGSQP